MAYSKLEYIWLDGYEPTQHLRSKTRVVHDFSGNLEDAPIWAFDGSSTLQAEGSSSDCLLKPVAIFPDPDVKNGYLVMTEVLTADGKPHSTNSRAAIDEDDDDFWFGFEQEYFLVDPETNTPLGFPVNGYPEPQGLYYCGVGARNVFGREIIDEHLDICLEAGLNVEGTNGEVAAGQWEFQIFAKGAARAGDEIWVGRYLIERTARKYGIAVDLHPKPLGDTDWNGSGMHANFSNGFMRDTGGEENMKKICEEFGKHIQEHIAVYGADNDKRLTGKHETQSIDKFSYGVSDRGASIRIPISTIEEGWKGRLEDRRPASNACPYEVASRIIKTVRNVKP
jgi:glutamine synthetase